MKTVSGLIFVAADTARSRAYAQALATAELAPQLTVCFGERGWTPPPSAAWPPDVSPTEGLVIPDLNETVLGTAARHEWAHEVLDTDSINSDLMVARLQASDAQLVLYSGFGGQLVKEAVLGLGKPFLHAHSGWLPDKPGSTTLYYSLLEDADIGVSAFLLEPSIDTGPVLLRRRFPFPPHGADVDYVYDTAVRAAVVSEVIATYERTSALPEAIEQPHRTSPFYVIHPVLKHLALLRLEELGQ